MSWDSIVKGVADVLKTVQGIGVVHEGIAWTDEVPSSTPGQSLFVKDGRFHCWNITRNPSAAKIALAQDGDNLYTVRHPVEIQGYLAHLFPETEKLWHPLCDRVQAAFRVQNRQLKDKNGVARCNTYRLPQADINAGMHASYMGVLCHRVTYSLWVEELVSIPGIVDTNVEVELLSGQSLHLWQMGLALVETIKPSVVGSVIPDASRIYLTRTLAGENVIYPGDPRGKLPRILVRIENASSKPTGMMAGVQSDFTYKATAHLQLRQNPGEDHQGKLVQALQRISAPFLGRFDPAPVMAIPGMYSVEAVPTATNVFDERRHEFDDPELTISHGEVQIGIIGRTKLTA